MSSTMAMAAEAIKSDQRWCELGDDRYGEYGVIGAEQADESHLDGRGIDQPGTEDDVGADGRIHFAKDKLYGREEELAQCQKLFDANESSAVVFLSGYSGSGKSRIVEEFIRLNSASVKDDKSGRRPSILFLCSKSDSMCANVPFSSIGSLFDNINKSVGYDLVGMRDIIQETLGTDVTLLLKVFPKLETFLSKDDMELCSTRSTSSSKSGSISISSLAALSSAKKKDTKKRMMFALQHFFRTLSSRSKLPLCLFIDDLQWVDGLSIELIQSILTDNTITNLFFFGSYQSNAVNEDHILTKKMQDIKKTRGEKALKGYLDIELKDLHKEALGHFIADSLRASYEEALPLTNVIFTKTLGNPFFTRQALEHLVRRNALYYDTISFRWDWKLQENELKDLLSADLLDMVKVKIEHMEPKLQEVLMMASCTRTTFDVDTIMVLLHPQFLRQSQGGFGANISEEVYKEEKKELIELLDQAVVEGLLVQPQVENISAFQSDETNGEEYAFAHDKIQETARGLISGGDEFKYLERIGNILQQRAQCPFHGEDWMFFAAREHLNHHAQVQHRTSVAQSEKQEEKKKVCLEKENQLRLANLNLRTAELSIDLLAFPAALDFCEQGIGYLPADHEERWSKKYKDTTLNLFSIIAQAKYGVGDNDAAERYCNQVIAQLRGDNPKVTTVEALPTFQIYLDIIADRGEKEAALVLCLEILSEFGTTVLKNTRMLRAKVWLTLKQIKSRLPTEESIRHLPQVMDPVVACKMELVQKAATLAFAADKTYLYILLSCESVKHISEHGLTDTSAASIASFANVLMHVYNDFKTSPQLAELAILISDRQENKFNETQPLNTANHNVLGWIRPISSTLKYHQRAYASGLASGNVNGAMVGKWFGLQAKLFSCSTTLPELEKEFREDVAEMHKCHQDFIGNVAGIVWQLVLNLIGKPGNPNTTVLDGEAINERTELYQQKMPTSVIFGPWKSMALLFFADYEGGAELALRRGDAFAKMGVGMMYGYDSVFRAVPLFIMARSDSSQRAKYKKEAMKLLERVRGWVKKGCIHLVGPHQLIEAECMASKRNVKSAKYHFEMAISTLRQDNFHHLAGLSCELYADYLLEVGDSKGSQIYLQGAVDNYRRWGAARKISFLKHRLSLIQ